MSEKNKKDIQPRHNATMEYDDNDLLNNPDEHFTKTSKNYIASVRRYQRNDNIPNYNNSGVSYKIADSYGQNNYGYQLIVEGSNGRIATRRKDQTNTSWKTPLYPPEQIPVAEDLSEIQVSGFYRTREQQSMTPKTKYIPDGASGWGVIWQMQENSNTGFQLYTPIDGQTKGTVYTRAFTNRNELKSSSNWRSIRLDAFRTIFTHPNGIAESNIDNITISGYYNTNQHTVGLPSQLNTDNDSKNGTLKVIRHGDDITQTYNASKGKFKNEIFIRTFNIHTRDADRLHWDKVGGTDGHTKIHDTRGNGEEPPNAYFQHSNADTGFLMYEWKWANDVNIHVGDFNPPLTGQRDLVVQTIVPTERDIQQGQSIVSQIAYDIVDHRYFWRKARDSAGHYWNGWEEVDGKNELLKPENTKEITNVSQNIPSGVYKTSPSCSGFDGVSVANKKGILQHFNYGNNNEFVQYWTPVEGNAGETGTFWSRVKKATGEYTQWKKISDGTAQGGGITEERATQLFIKKFERAVNVSELNNLKTSGIYSVGGDRGAPFESSWNIIMVMAKDTGYVSQLAIACSGGNMGKLKTRGLHSGVWSPWVEASGITQQQADNRYLQTSTAESTYAKKADKIGKPEIENAISDANTVQYSGVFRTDNSHPTGLPNSSQTDGYDGFLTYYRYNSNHGIQYWQTHKGKARGKVFTRYIDGNGWSAWTEVGAGTSPQPIPPTGGITAEQAKQIFREELKKLFEQWKTHHTTRP